MTKNRRNKAQYECRNANSVVRSFERAGRVAAREASSIYIYICAEMVIRRFREVWIAGGPFSKVRRFICSKSNRCNCRLVLQEILEIRHEKQANRCRGLTKPKISLQLYNVFVLDRPNRPRGVTKRLFRKRNRSRGSTKHKIPLERVYSFK